MTPTVFVSYSHAGEDHSNWVLQLATRLRSNGVDIILDKWNLDLGHDVGSFIEKGLSESHRILCICSTNYVNKANNGKGGVGYEKKIMTAEIMADLNSNWVIPIIRNNQRSATVPTFLAGSLYVDFEDDRLYESQYEQLLRSLLSEPVSPIPPLGKNPFETVKQYANQKFGSSAEFVGKTVFHRRLRRPRCSPSLKASLASSAAAPALTLGCAPRCRLVWAMGNGASGGGSGHRV